MVPPLPARHSQKVWFPRLTSYSLQIKEYPFDIIAMSETWLKDNSHLLNYVTISGYSCVFRDRENIRGGGVEIYVSDSQLHSNDVCMHGH